MSRADGPVDFSDRPRKGQVAPDPRPYHEMTPQEQREAWAALRERQQKQARRHHKAPIVLALTMVALWVVGLWLADHGSTWGGILLWAGVAFAGFAVIAWLRNLIGSLSTRKDDLTPPGF